MLYAALLTLQVLLIAELLRRLTFMHAAVLCTIYITLAQIYFIYRSSIFSEIVLPPGSLGSFFYRTNEGFVFYSGLFFAICISTVGVSNKKALSIRSTLIYSSHLKRLLLPAAIILSVITFIRIVSIDWSILWKNYQYLLISSSDGLAYNNAIFRFTAGFSTVVLISSSILFACALCVRRKGTALLLFFCVSTLTIIAMAGASRSAALSFLAVGATLFIFGSKRQRTAGVVISLLALPVIFLALVGRATGEFGISSIPLFYSSLISVQLGAASEVVIRNLSQGIFVTTDSIYLGGNFSTAYKILSFSPLPSFIDGFDSIRSNGQIRLHGFVPMSAIGEAYNFGIIWFLSFLGFLIYAFRTNAKIDIQSKPLLFCFSSLLLFVFFAMANTYPLRNIFRQFLLAIALMKYSEIRAWAVVLFPRRSRPFGI